MGQKLIKLVTALGFVTLTLTSLFAGAMYPVLAQQKEKFTGLKLRAVKNDDFVYEYRVNAGQTVTGKFIAQHDFEDKGKYVKYYLMSSDFIVNPDDGEVVYPSKSFSTNSKYSLAKYFKFNREYVELSSFGQEQEVEFSVTIPAGTPGGTYFAAIVLSNITAEQYKSGEVDIDANGQSGAGIGSRLSPVVIITVNGDLKTNVDMSLVVEDIFGNQAKIFEYLPLKIRAQISNTGNTFMMPLGDIFIHTGDSANPLKTFPLNPNRNRVLPESSRPYSAIWENSLIYFQRNNSFPGGGYITFRPDLGNLKIGHYYANAVIKYKDAQNKDQRLDMTTDFWVIPWKLILALLLIVALVVYRLYKKSQEGEDNKKSRAKSKK